MSIAQLASAVRANLDTAQRGPDAKIYNVDLIERVIHESQRQQPGAWQDWGTAEKVKPVSRWIREAARQGETGAERIYLMCGGT